MRLGALETGGTKMVCAIGDENGNIFKEKTIPTRKPDETIPEIITFFKDEKIDSLGIACFGPIDLDRGSKTYGYITSTPKREWADFDIVGSFKKALNVPVGFDTDVNGSLLGEVTFGYSKGLSDVVYITVGTGIGGGVISNGNLLHGMLHPELGHMLVTKHPDDDHKSVCPFHESCLEGLASGPSIRARYGKGGEELTGERKVWETEAYYLSQAVVNIILTLSPKRIIFGGSVMKQAVLFDLIRDNVTKMLNGYIKADELKDIGSYIVPESLGGKQGILGCFKLAEMEYEL